mmetsp:Transcript_10771/g.26141  ORF Transcript_10771/g.26141 Transcript_10771/m.26141 type:complete len:84 (+) Transcript_10771:2-253(+)
MKAGCLPLLGRAVRDSDGDATVACLAAQSLLEATAPPGDRRADPQAHAELEGLLGGDWHGKLSLAARRMRPSSPDELDMLLVM